MCLLFSEAILPLLLFTYHHPYKDVHFYNLHLHPPWLPLLYIDIYMYLFMQFSLVELGNVELCRALVSCKASSSQCSLHSASVFLLKVAMSGMRQCDFLNLCGASCANRGAKNICPYIICFFEESDMLLCLCIHIKYPCGCGAAEHFCMFNSCRCLLHVVLET